MLLNILIINTLKPLNIPVSYLQYSGKEPTYITFFQYNELGNCYAENKEVATDYYYQVDIWSKSDYTQLAENVKAFMENAGFKRTSSQDLYEPDTKIYHKGIRFIYTQKSS